MANTQQEYKAISEFFQIRQEILEALKAIEKLKRGVLESPNPRTHPPDGRSFGGSEDV